MSVNTAHANNGVLLHAGEMILLFSDNVTMEFSGQDDQLFRGSKVGRIYLTTHRMIYNSKNPGDAMLSFSFPFIALHDVELEQPAFSANYIKGKIRAQPNGNWIGEAKFKLYFKTGGAIDFGQAMLRAARMAQRQMHSDVPPAYTPPSGAWHEAPPPAYQPPPGYYGWLPTNEAFTTGPPPNSVFVSDNPPPYPGIGPQPHQPQQGYSPNGYPGGYPGNNMPGQQQPGYPGAPQGGYPGAPQGGYPGAPQSAYHGFPNAQPPSGYPGVFPPQGGYPGTVPGGYSGYPGNAGNPGYPENPTPYAGNAPGYPQPSGAMGFSSPNVQPNSKEAEAQQSAYNNTVSRQSEYAPPPGYYDPPPSYNSLPNQK